APRTEDDDRQTRVARRERMARRDSTPGGGGKGVRRRPAAGRARPLAEVWQAAWGLRGQFLRPRPAPLRRWRQLMALLAFLPALLLPVAGGAIVIRHDQADSRYVVADADYPQVFFLHTRYGNRV